MNRTRCSGLAKDDSTRCSERKKKENIGVGRLRILGGARFRILGGQGGGGQIPSRHMTSY